MNFYSASQRRTALGLSKAADVIGCDLATLEAVILVETGGQGFDKEKRPKALFEPHIFYKLLKGRKDAAPLAQAIRAGLAYAKWGTKPYPRDSYPRIAAACKVDEELALQATSWGLPQILGANHRSAGYASAKKMVEAFKSGEDEQLAAMARFIKAKGLDRPLRLKDWAAFAKGYNGPAYQKHAYDVKLAKAYASALKGSARQEPITPATRNSAAAAQARSSGGAVLTGATALGAIGGAGAITTTSGNPWFDAALCAAVLVAVGLLLFVAAQHFRRAETFKEG